MNAGKTAHLLQTAFNYEAADSKVALYTAAKDKRSGEGVISSRIGPQFNRHAYTYHESTNFDQELNRLEKASCILIDEAQFLKSSQVKELHRLCHTRNQNIICYGIRSDFLGNPFEGSSALLALADSIREISTVCGCLNPATMNIRTNSDGERVNAGEQVLIGGNDCYRQVCSTCFYKQP